MDDNCKGYEERWNFPHCLGALDGKHVTIKPPAGSGSFYFNYKGTHSIILMALVNANYEFIYADVGTNGRAPDAGVWDQSDLRNVVDSGSLGIPPATKLPNSNKVLPYVFVGDDAFPLKTSMMKPYSHRTLDHEERIFSYRLSRTRRTVENAFGILSNRFRVFLAPINLAPQKVEKVILACLVMHNILRRLQPEYTAPGSVDVENLEEGIVIPGAWQTQERMLQLQPLHPRNVPKDAKEVRKQFKEYFNNEGAVPWQENAIQGN